MFIERFRLETNPFGAEGIRPFFTSHAVRGAQLKLERLLDGGIQTLFVTGAPGVGKSTLIRQHLRARKDLSLSRIRPETAQQPDELLRKLLKDIGPGDVQGSVQELRNILHVFLRHQAAHNRLSFVVADALERFTVPLIRELDVLSRVGLRNNRPAVHCVLLTRSEELIGTLMEQQEPARLAQVLHHRLAGFALEETAAYVRSCLHDAGCSDVDQLLPEEALFDIQGFTGGVVGDINALCREALASLAAGGGEGRPPSISRELLRGAARHLNLSYDPSVRQRRVETALARESAPPALEDGGSALPRLQITNGAEDLSEFSLDRPRLVLGRDEACDIIFDSAYLSRFQSLFMETAAGWLLIDLNSTNGSFVNGRRVREHALRDGDLIAIGQYQLRFVWPAGEGRARAERTSDETAVSPKPAIGKSA